MAVIHQFKNNNFINRLQREHSAEENNENSILLPFCPLSSPLITIDWIYVENIDKYFLHIHWLTEFIMSDKFIKTFTDKCIGLTTHKQLAWNLELDKLSLNNSTDVIESFNASFLAYKASVEQDNRVVDEFNFELYLKGLNNDTRIESKSRFPIEGLNQLIDVINDVTHSRQWCMPTYLYYSYVQDKITK